MSSTLDKIMLSDYVEETGMTYKEIYEISKGLKYAEENNLEKKNQKDETKAKTKAKI